MQGFKNVHDRVVFTILNKFCIGLCCIRPIPSVCKSVKLRLTDFSALFAKKQSIIRIGIKRRVEINQINRWHREKFRDCIAI